MQACTQKTPPALWPQEYKDEENGKHAKRRYQVGRVTLRTLFFDRHLLAALKGGARQVVLLGAGMDSRAWRLDLPPGATGKPLRPSWPA